MKFPKGNVPWNKGFSTKNVLCKTCDKSFPVSRYRREIDNRGKFCSWICRWNYKYKLAKLFVITPDMAELIGVIIGDGCINKYTKQNSYRITISGNKIEDKPYMENYLPNLIRKCIKKQTKPFIGKNGAYIIQFSNEPFRIFLLSLNITPRKGRIVRIPDLIKKDSTLLKRCIRGIADTDFTVIGANKNGKKNVYPRIEAQFASENLVRDLEESLRSFSFTLNTVYNRKIKDKRGHKWVSNFINLDGPHNLEKWLKMIEFRNSRIITRYKYLQKFGYLPPKTTLPQRMKALEMVGGDDSK